MNPTTVELVATVLFGLAVIHTFLVSKFQHIANKYPEGSIQENFFHLLGEVEVVFGVWAGVLVAVMAVLAGSHDAIHYVEDLNYTEPVFVFAIMTIAATKPILIVTSNILHFISDRMPLPGAMGMYFVVLTVGPLLGSFITEPAAMTITALLLKSQYLDKKLSNRFKYTTLAVLFVNVSIGGVLTPFAAPPVLMVAGKWGWDMSFMVSQFGLKSILAVVFNGMLATLTNSRELIKMSKPRAQSATSPSWLVSIHILFLAAVVFLAHYPQMLFGVFLFFIGVATITQELQEPLRLKESLLVAFFLGGLVTFGALQRWWLQPILMSMDELGIFLAAAGLTAITDNAALTYLGSQVENLSDVMKYSLVAGAVAGGGLTVIANAPNPAGYSILNKSFGPSGINPLKLLLSALVPTAVALMAFWFGPTV